MPTPEHSLDDLLREGLPLRRPISEHPIGYLRIRQLPYPVRYHLASEADPVVTNEQRPARFLVTPDLAGGKTLSVYIWEGVPEDFREVLLAHELVEASLVLRGVAPEAAHTRAVAAHHAYARRHLSAARADDFLSWQRHYAR